jgi:DNA-binding CsgD family transcriptional regulator
LAVRGGARQAVVVPTLRSPVLIGRQAELASALRLVDAAARGRGGGVLVTGEAGVGKSRLVDEMRARAVDAGMTVLVGRSVADGGTYRAVTEALAKLLRGRPRLDDPALLPYRAALRRLLPVLDGDPLPTAPDPTVMLGEGVLALLAGRSTLLVLEDLHWADPDTVDLVRYLAGALVDAPVLLVATARDDLAQPGITRLAAEVPILALHRLDADGVAALAAACRGAPLPPAELDELVARADGLPLLVEELLAVGSTRVPPSLASLVAGRLAALPPSARRVVLAAAVLGEPDWQLLAAITASPTGGSGSDAGSAAGETAPGETVAVGAAPELAVHNEVEGDEAAVIDALRAGVEVGLLVVADGRLRFRHALTRDAALATLLPPERAALAARAARVLDARGDRAVAARLFAEAGDPARGAAILVELARADVGRGAVRSAAAFLDEAGEHAAPAERVHVLTLLGRAVEALEIGERALDGLRGAERAELCLRLARAAIVAGRWADARRLVESAGRPDDPRALVLVADAAYGAGDVAQAERLARTAADAARDPALLCEALSVLGRSTFATDPAASDAVLRRVAQVAAEHGLLPWRVQALFGLGSHEHTRGDPVAPSLTAARDLALEAGMLVVVVQADLLRANAVLLVDGPVAALPLLRGAAERAGRLRLTGLQAMAELCAAIDAGLAGDEAAMSRWLAAALARPDAPTEVTTLGPMVHALPHLLRHSLRTASALFDEAVPALLEHGSAVPLDHIGLWALLRTAIGDRDHAAREALRGHDVLMATGIRAALGYADAIAGGRAGRAAEAEAHMAAADAALVHLPWWNRLLRLFALEGAVVDGWGDPVPTLRADLAAHEAAGAESLARTCRDLLRTAGAPTRRRGGPVTPGLRARGVTAREAEVLALVAAGLTNAEAAERLFLSRRTVETHVARLLAKTGAADRSELRRWT